MNATITWRRPVSTASHDIRAEDDLGTGVPFITALDARRLVNSYGTLAAAAAIYEKVVASDKDGYSFDELLTTAASYATKIAAGEILPWNETIRRIHVRLNHVLPIARRKID